MGGLEGSQNGFLERAAQKGASGCCPIGRCAGMGCGQHVWVSHFLGPRNFNYLIVYLLKENQLLESGKSQLIK